MGSSIQNPPSSGISVSRIAYRYGKKPVLTDVTFTAQPGSIVGIVGINGGGKSTLLSILAGVRRPGGGSFTCCGTDLFRERGKFQELVGYLPQENPLLEDLTVTDNLRLWYGQEIPADLPVLRQMQLTELLQLRVKSLSGGMKRRLSIACAVAGSQPVLVLDEPSSSLDLHQKRIISDFITGFTSDGGMVLLSTHDMEEIRLCTKLVYLEDGVSVPVSAGEAIERLQAGKG